MLVGREVMADNLASNPDSPSRTFLKCTQCRKDGKKCEDSRAKSCNDNRAIIRWTKCRRCTRLGHKCGPRVRADSKRQRAVSCPAETDEASPDQILTNIVTYLVIQCVLLRCRCELWPLSRRLPDDPLFNEQRSRLRDMNLKLDQLYRTAARDWQLHSQKQEASSDIERYLISENLQLRFENGRWQHNWLDVNWGDNPDATCPAPSTAQQHRSLHQNEQEYVLCTRWILNGIDLATCRILKYPIQSPQIHIDKYLEASVQLQKIFEPFFADTNTFTSRSPSQANVSNHGISRVLFPAAQIAYWNLDKEAAFRLSTQSGVLDLPNNAFNQNLLHLIAMAGDRGFLDRLVDFDRVALARASVNRIDHSPLDFATVMDDYNMFNCMIGRCINISPWTPHLMHLAVTAQSLNVVGIILERKDIVLPPYTDAVVQAIQLGAKEIVQKIGPFLISSGTSRAEIEDLARQAEAIGMGDVACSLYSMRSPPDVPEEALKDLQRYQTALADNNTIFMPPTDHDMPTAYSNGIYFLENIHLSQYEDVYYGDGLIEGGATS